MSFDINNIPLVSIIITTYNRKNMLKIALESVLKQTYENLEIIVADNASCDGTNTFMNEYTKIHNNIIYIKREKNMGAYYNGYNAYKEISKGKYIFFLCDDDYMISPTFIANAVDVMENNANVILTTGFVLMYIENIDNYLTIPYNKNQLINGMDYFLRQSTFSLHKSHPEIISLFFLIRRDCLENYPILESFKESGDVAIRFYAPSLGDIYFLQEFVGCYNIHKNFRETSNMMSLNSEIKNTLNFIEVIKKRYIDIYPNYKDFFEKYIPIKIADAFIRDRIYKSFNMYIINNQKKKEVKNFLKKYFNKKDNIYKFLSKAVFNSEYAKQEEKIYFNICLLKFNLGDIDICLIEIKKSLKYLHINIFGIKINIRLNFNERYYKIPELYAYANRDLQAQSVLKDEYIYYDLNKTSENQLSSYNIEKYKLKTLLKNIKKGDAIMLDMIREEKIIELFRSRGEIKCKIQTRPDQTRPDQTRPDQTRPDQIGIYTAIVYSLIIIIQYIKNFNLRCNINIKLRRRFFV